MGVGMKEYILVDKLSNYMVAELNLCQHKWIHCSHSANSIINFVVSTGRTADCQKLSVITRDHESLKVESYPVWSKTQR